MFRNLPNFLTVLRLILVPFVVRQLAYGNYRQALLLVFIAGSTDALDGYLARRFNWTTKLGAYLDPIGDKLLLVSVYITLAVYGAIPRWLMWLVLGRDVWILLMVAVAFLLTSVRRFPPSVWGKMSTIVQVFTALIVIASRAYWSPQPTAFETAPIWLTAAVSVWSGLHYTWLALLNFTRYRN